MLNESLNLIECAGERVFVSFTTEDATRIPVRKLLTIYREAVERGAKRIHLSDTVGVATVELVENYVTVLKNLNVELTELPRLFNKN